MVCKADNYHAGKYKKGIPAKWKTVLLFMLSMVACITAYMQIKLTYIEEERTVLTILSPDFNILQNNTVLVKIFSMYNYNILIKHNTKT